MKGKLYKMVVVGLAVGALAFGGCKAKEGAEAGKEGAPAAAEKAGGQASAPAGEVKTMEDLCKKYITEMSAANKAKLPADAEKSAMDSCMGGTKMMAAMPKANEMIEKYITAIMNACEGKAGEEWVKCYTSEGANAMQAAMK